MIDIKSTSWTQKEEGLAIAVLEKIAYCQDQSKEVPGFVWEAHIRSKKNISTEMVLLNALGQVYLIQRPSKEENPSEPYPGQWHCPGVTHWKNHFTEDTLERLTQKEFGGVEVVNPRRIDIQEVKDEKRGMYILQIFIGRVDAEPKNPKGRFFCIDEIPWDDLLKSHREIIIPAAIKALEKM